jgi:hypothetical protein
MTQVQETVSNDVSAIDISKMSIEELRELNERINDQATKLKAAVHQAAKLDVLRFLEAVEQFEDADITAIANRLRLLIECKMDEQARATMTPNMKAIIVSAEHIKEYAEEDMDSEYWRDYFYPTNLDIPKLTPEEIKAIKRQVKPEYEDGKPIKLGLLRDAIRKVLNDGRSVAYRDDLKAFLEWINNWADEFKKQYPELAA